MKNSSKLFDCYPKIDCYYRTWDAERTESRTEGRHLNCFLKCCRRCKSRTSKTRIDVRCALESLWNSTRESAKSSKKQAKLILMSCFWRRKSSGNEIQSLRSNEIGFSHPCILGDRKIEISSKTNGGVVR